MDISQLKKQVQELELKAKIKKLGGSIESKKMTTKIIHKEKSEETKMNEELKRLETERERIENKSKEVAKGKGFFGRAWTGFKAHNQQYAIQSQIRDIKGISEAKRKNILFSEQAKALEQRRRLNEAKEKSNINMNRIFGSTEKKPYKAITFDSLGVK